MLYRSIGHAYREKASPLRMKNQDYRDPNRWCTRFEPIKKFRLFFMSFSRIECVKKRISWYDYRIYSQIECDAIDGERRTDLISRAISLVARSYRVFFWKELRNAFARISGDHVAAKYKDRLLALFVHVMKHERPMLTIEKKALKAMVWNDDMKI